MIKNNVFSKAAITGLLLIAVSLWMMAAGKVATSEIWMPDGFKVPILALEFGSSVAEIQKIVISISANANANILFATQIDMLFAVIYSLFLFFALRAIYTITNLNQYKWLALLPILIMAADIAENFQIVNALGNFEINLWVLKIATWIKWLGLAVAFTAVGRFLITTGRYFDKVLALSTYVTIPLGVWAMFAHNGINEVFAMLFYLLFPLTIIYAWFPGVKKKG